MRSQSLPACADLKRSRGSNEIESATSTTGGLPNLGRVVLDITKLKYRRTSLGVQISQAQHNSGTKADQGAPLFAILNKRFQRDDSNERRVDQMFGQRA